jgi:hypothetical protein
MPCERSLELQNRVQIIRAGTKIKRLQIIVVCVFTLFTTTALAGSPGIYQEQAVKTIGMIDRILMEHKLCSDGNDCTKKKLAFFSRTSTGIYIEVYRIRSSALIQQIVDACITVYIDNGQSMDVSLSMYHQSHEELMGFAKWRKDPLVSIQMKGRQ